MGAQQHRYGSAQVVTHEVVRVEVISYLPQEGMINVFYVIGEEVSGSFVRHDSKEVTIAYGALSAALQTTFDDLETKALNYGSNQGVFVSGSVESL